MLGAMLLRHEVVQVRQPGEKRLLASLGMMKAFHREQLPLDSVIGLIQQGTGHGHLRADSAGRQTPWASTAGARRLPSPGSARDTG